MDEGELLGGLKSGDEHAYHAVFMKYYTFLLAFAFKIVRDEENAKDVIQVIFTRMYTSRESISIQQDLRSYLIMAVRNECLNFIKKEKRLRENQEEFAFNAGDKFFLNAIEEAESENRIYKAIRELPPQCQKIFTMSRIDEKKNQEIATELGISIRTVETQISNALKALRRSLLMMIFF